MNIGIVGVGYVGGAIKNFFENLTNKTYEYNLLCYDLYKKIGKINDILESDILFICLPTPFKKGNYDQNTIEDFLLFLSANNYNKIVVIKSTLLPKSSQKYSELYNLKIIHNPEFLSAKSYLEDFINQTYIVLGNTTKIKNNILLYDIYKREFPNAIIKICHSDESEAMKIFSNSFYASKIQIFNEFYLLCRELDIDYNNVKKLMVNKGWINNMHTNVPGHDRKLSYGGLCFPKDINGLVALFKHCNITHNVLEAVIHEQKKIRDLPP